MFRNQNDNQVDHDLMPLVSVIIVTHNSSGYIVQCLRSLQDDVELGLAEIILYDNNSVDNTPDVISNEFPGVKLLRSDKNIGFAAANNAAVQQANGDILVFLNPDTIVTADWLQLLLSVLQSEATIGAVTPTVVYAQTPDIIQARGNEIHLSGITYCRDLGQPISSGINLEVGAVSGAAFAIRKELFNRLGGFEVEFFMYFEDTDLSLKLRCAGYKCVLATDSVVQHCYEPRFTSQKIYFLERNRYLSLFTLLPWQILLVAFPSLLFIELAVWLFCILKGKSAIGSKMRAWRHVVRHWPWIYRRRQKYAMNCAEVRFMLGAFSPRLQIHYIDARKSLLTSALEIAGWLVAYPLLGAARFIANGFAEFNRYRF
jgi:GT2 family glycosyltransferase